MARVKRPPTKLPSIGRVDMTAVGGRLPQEQPEGSREREKNETSADDPTSDQHPAKRQKLDMDASTTNGSTSRVPATLVKSAQVR